MSTFGEALRRHSFCMGLDPAQIEAVAGCVSEVTFADGQLLARAGQKADATFLIRGGRVALRAGQRTIETVEEDEIVGWSWLFDDTTWHVDAVASGAVRALRLDGACLDARMKADPALGHAVARCLLRQVHSRLERARLQSLDVYGERR